MKKTRIFKRQNLRTAASGGGPCFFLEVNVRIDVRTSGTALFPGYYAGGFRR